MRKVRRGLRVAGAILQITAGPPYPPQYETHVIRAIRLTAPSRKRRISAAAPADAIEIGSPCHSVPHLACRTAG
jgi:hypothetical protein